MTTEHRTAPDSDPVTAEPRWLDQSQQRSWRALLVGHTLLMARLDDDLRRGFDLSLTEYEILVRLSERDGRLRMAQLADAMAHSRSRVTHTVARMERAGLVERVSSPEDGRGILASLTERGLDVLRQAAPMHVAGVREHLVDLADADDLAAVGRVMNVVADHLVAGHPEMDIR
ncbi:MULTISPECIES: MarR family winged helix-turn-helix transcriptional regulator [Nocardioides]|uniref:MarR family transcriptional regulator n=1 Tax=Nocardioides kribbensis TaxID=305517 RepID=A0ABV1NZL5_9ACTN|nr:MULTISPECIES: MarR family transcriptional regulator [Nocardioides]MBJ7530209.1 MarR family transcriptional regulator [Nocardioides sp.]